MTGYEDNPYASSSIDPEIEVAAPFDGELANRGLRFVGSLIDNMLTLIVVVPTSMVLGLLLYGTVGESPSTDFILTILSSVLVILAILAIHGYLLATRGQTVGKLLLGMKIVSDDGRPLAFAEMFFKRYVVLILLSLIPIVGNIFGLLDAVMIFRSSHKCLHDDFAKTKVIKLPAR